MTFIYVIAARTVHAPFSENQGTSLRGQDFTSRARAIGSVNKKQLEPSWREFQLLVALIGLLKSGESDDRELTLVLVKSALVCVWVRVAVFLKSSFWLSFLPLMSCFRL